MSKKQVKCNDCGFLALKKFPLRHKTKTPLSILQKMKILEMLEPKECTTELKKNWAENGDLGSVTVTCYRNMWDSYDHEIIEEEGIYEFLTSERKCPVFFPHNPGYSPIEHKELQREDKTQSLLIKGMILAAVIGALIGALITALINVLSPGGVPVIPPP